jgi:hypothetical protein
MKPLPGVSEYGLVPVPPMPDTQACSDKDNQLLTADNANTSRRAARRTHAVLWIELREISWLAFIVIGLSILSVGAAVALAFAL